MTDTVDSLVMERAAQATPNAHHEENMKLVRAAMRRHPDVFNVDADVDGRPVGGLRVMNFVGLGTMASFTNALVVAPGATEYIRDKPFVVVWLESAFDGDVGCPRLEMGQGPIYFSFNNFEHSFADAVKEVRAQMVNADVAASAYSDED